MGSGKKDQDRVVFSEQVDRILSGRDEIPNEILDTDLRSALEFARKMTKLRSSPSPQFESLLKARLIQRLIEQGDKARTTETQGWTGWFISHRPAWQAATAVVVILAAAGIAWATGVFDTRPSPVVSIPATTSAGGTVPATSMPAATTPVSTKPPATSIPAPVPGILLAVDASTDKIVYQYGEEVKIAITLRNAGLQTLRLEQFPPITSLMQSESRQPVYTFRAGQDTRVLDPEESAFFEISWRQIDFHGRPVPGGEYYLELEDLDYQGQSVQLQLLRPARFEVLPLVH